MTAQHVLDLYDMTEASRPACAIALAKRLPELGAVVIIDRQSRTVTHASVKPDPERGWPRVFPWPRQQVAEGHPLLQLRPGSATARRIRWRTPWGAEADYYVHAVAEGNRIIAVLSDSDLWAAERFHPRIDRDYDTRPLLSGFCCGSAFEVRGYPCPDCQQPYCPRCRECRCQVEARSDALCTGCFLMFKPHLVVDGRCEECR